jgi:hypothetical protein
MDPEVGNYDTSSQNLLGAVELREGQVTGFILANPGWSYPYYRVQYALGAPLEPSRPGGKLWAVWHVGLPPTPGKAYPEPDAWFATRGQAIRWSEQKNAGPIVLEHTRTLDDNSLETTEAALVLEQVVAGGKLIVLHADGHTIWIKDYVTPSTIFYCTPPPSIAQLFVLQDGVYVSRESTQEDARAEIA